MRQINGLARLYADEDSVAGCRGVLRRLGHDMLTVQEAGRADQGISDSLVLVDATNDKRAILTHNHAISNACIAKLKLHQGIISCTHDRPDRPACSTHQFCDRQVRKIDEQFIRIVRPSAILTAMSCGFAGVEHGCCQRRLC